MPTISDVFAFAAANADYWTEFFSGNNYPEALTDEEVRGLNAARTHIDSLVVELLHSTGNLCAKEISGGAGSTPRFKAASTVKNRWVSLPAPTRLDGKLYRIEFSLAENDATKRIELYASLVVKIRALDNIRASLDKRGLAYAHDGYHLYMNGLELTQGIHFEELSKSSVCQALELLSVFNDQTTSPK